MKIGLLGCGNIGGVISKAIDEGEIENTQLICVYDKTREKAEKLVNSLKKKPIVVDNIRGFFNQRVDLIVEAASQEAVRECILPLLEKNISVLVMSVGALLEEELKNEVVRACIKHDVKVYVPSGAIVGLDGIKSAASGRIDEVSLCSIKPKKALKDNEYLKQKGIDINEIMEETVVFEGVARDAVKLFPKSVNVCAALSLAGIGADKTKVKILVNPTADRIRHIISVRGDFGDLITEVNNIPSPKNPKTSYLACLSAITMLKKLSGETLSIGT